MAWSPKAKVLVVWPKLVMVMVRVVAGLVEVWMPKSSSLGVTTMGFAVAVVAGRVMV